MDFGIQPIATPRGITIHHLPTDLADTVVHTLDELIRDNSTKTPYRLQLGTRGRYSTHSWARVRLTKPNAFQENEAL
eukprot:4043280-Prorocentrum_lima.AAC.1